MLQLTLEGHYAYQEFGEILVTLLTLSQYLFCCMFFMTYNFIFLGNQYNFNYNYDRHMLHTVHFVPFVEA